MKSKNKKVYRSNDFYLCVFLKASGWNILEIDRANPHRVFFVFEYVENEEKLIEDFLFSRSLIEPQKIIAAIKELKQLIIHQPI